jgi:hypothetical protein
MLDKVKSEPKRGSVGSSPKRGSVGSSPKRCSVGSSPKRGYDWEGPTLPRFGSDCLPYGAALTL